MRYYIKTIKNYPDNGKHQECFVDFPFLIRKGADGYYYRNKKGVELKYNLDKNYKIIDKRWIVHLKDTANSSLCEIFEIKVHKDLDVIIKYCTKVYLKSLKLEIKRIEKELNYIKDLTINQ